MLDSYCKQILNWLWIWGNANDRKYVCPIWNQTIGIINLEECSETKGLPCSSSPRGSIKQRQMEMWDPSVISMVESEKPKLMYWVIVRISLLVTHRDSSKNKWIHEFLDIKKYRHFLKVYCLVNSARFMGILAFSVKGKEALSISLIRF